MLCLHRVFDGWMHVKNWSNDTDKKTEVLGENPDPLPLGTPQTSHFTDGQNRTSFTEILIK